MAAPITVFANAELDLHTTPDWHPERPGRLEASLSGISEAGLVDAVAVPRAPPGDGVRAGTGARARLRRTARSGSVSAVAAISTPTPLLHPVRGTRPLRAAGAVLDAVDALEAGSCDVAFAAGRPPGHHAVPDRAMGFCLVNNVAVAAAKLAADGQRVAIVDWDVHHGNGTQDIFYNDPRCAVRVDARVPALSGQWSCGRDRWSGCTDVEPQSAVSCGDPRRRVSGGRSTR